MSRPSLVLLLILLAVSITGFSARIVYSTTDFGNGVYREDYVSEGYSLLYIPLSYMSSQVYSYDRDVTPSDPGEGVGVTVYCPTDGVYMALLYIPSEWATVDGYKLVVTIGYPTHPEGTMWAEKSRGVLDFSTSTGKWVVAKQNIENTDPSGSNPDYWRGHVAVWFVNLLVSTSTGEVIDTSGVFEHVKSASELTYKGSPTHDDTDVCPCSGYEKWSPSRYRMMSLLDKGWSFWLEEKNGEWYIVLKLPLQSTGGEEPGQPGQPSQPGNGKTIVMKGIWVWGATIRGHEQEFYTWVKQHGFSDIFLLIKGVSGTDRYDVLSQLVQLRDSDTDNPPRVWAWLVGFHDTSHSDPSWDYLVGDWVSPDDPDYRSHIYSIVRNAVDPSRGHVPSPPDGVMLDDTFQWPSSSYGGSTSHRVESITSIVAEIASIVRGAENATGRRILLGFAPHPETETYDSSNGWSYAAYTYGQDYGELSVYCDLLMPETYRYGFYDKPSTWITSVVNDIRAEIAREHPERNNSVYVIPALVLYYSDTDPTPVPGSSLSDDVDAALAAAPGLSVFRYMSASSNPGAGADSYDEPTGEQLAVLDNVVVNGTLGGEEPGQPSQPGQPGGGEPGQPAPGAGDPWNHTVYGDLRDHAMYHQQPSSYDDSGFSSGSYKGWCGVASMYIALHTLVPDLPSRLKTAYPSWTDPEFGRGLVDSDPYIYHEGSTYAVEALMVYKGIGYDSGTNGYGYSELVKIIDWINSLNIGVEYEYQYVPLSEMRYRLMEGWVAIMNVQTGHYVAVVAYTEDDPSDSTRRYYWILDPWPTSYIGPGSTWDPSTEDPDGDGYPEFNVDLTWDWRSLIWSRQPHGTTGYYQGIYVMTAHGVNEVFRDQLGNSKVLMVRLVENDAGDRYVLVSLPSQPPSGSDTEYAADLLKLINGYIYSGAPGVMVEERVVLRGENPDTGSTVFLTVEPGSVILRGVSAYYMLKASEYTYGCGAGAIYWVDPYTSNKSYSVIALARPRIYMYTGDGTIYDTIASTLSWLRFNYDEMSDPSKLERLSIARFRYAVVLMPGGSATTIASGIGSDGLHTIAEFVERGGGYIGICAGSYLPVKGYNTETGWLQIVNATVEALNPGEGIVTINITGDDPVTYGFTGTIQMAYYNGPPLSPGGLSSTTTGKPAPVPSVDAVFVDGPSSVLYQRAAILTTRYGDGKIVLFSPHPEHSYYQSSGDLPLGKYIWRLLWNAVHYTSGNETTVQVTAPEPVPEPHTAVTIIVIGSAAATAALVVLYTFKRKH